jgi:opacity protein-like surface antigen
MVGPGCRRSLMALVLLGALYAGPAYAQPAQGAIVSGAVGAMAIDSTTSFSFSVAAGYRFNRAFGLGVEITSAPSLDSDFSNSNPVPLIGVPRDVRNPDGEVTAFTANVRLEVPTTSPRVVPYAIAGGGVANIKESFEVIILGIPTITNRDLMSTAIYPPPYWEPYRASSTNLALAFGGGVSVLAGDHLSLDVDLRYLRLVGDTDRNVGRFGAGASYRF